MDGFTPLSAVLGGVMIGAAAALFLILNGRIAGISGILGGLLALPPTGQAGASRSWEVWCWRRSPMPDWAEAFRR